ncbi:putative regulatory protein, FmdB family [Neorhodopirellula lusitana]|uniref:Regulatory protein, FmdB family n=1 Tax=Neorhodopirellula lusitana TaxID=445327 RepID=A0ABY1QJ75_9BACT|nr:FmdB family zinc ribbon protein [Neorhodopirellula lusitana]SMP73053.1 putative regulatory protein, FmdB family [Neorhodopirellula lusitana]
MPLYEFECGVCSEASGVSAAKEILVRSSDEAVVCPDCGSDQLVRLMSATAAPASGRSLPIGGPGSAESCAAPRCCGGGCQM